MSQARQGGGAAKAKKTIIFLLQITLFIFLVENLGWIGFGLSVFLFAFLIIWRKWDQFILVKQTMEEKIWGKPLKFFDPGELKKVKVKIIWGKKKKQLD